MNEIHVNSACKVRQDHAGVRAGHASAAFRYDHVICHLESVNTSAHVEETRSQTARSRKLVSVAEQEYLLQNVLTEPVTFVVEHQVPKRWRIDSDPPPSEVQGTTATFRVVAQPGEIVRLHVGERRVVPLR